MFKFKKTPEIVLDEEMADKILKNIFEKTNVEPNSIPLEVLTAYSSYRKERFFLQRSILVIMMVIFLMLPFLFIAPDFSINADDDKYTSTPAYEVALNSSMPVSRVTATIDGRNVPVYEVDAHKYSIEPPVNGRMKVTVTLLNKQQTTQYIDVDNVDMDVPILISSNWDDDYLYLTLTDNQSGINFDEVKAVKSGGSNVSPVSYNESTGRIVFAYPDDSLNIYIPDNAGNALHLVINLK